MDWISVKDRLPPLDKSYRCLAEISVEKEGSSCWTGFADVYFTATHGWRRCENQEMVFVRNWIFISELQPLPEPPEE